jgi:hypothetical protein
MGDMQKVISMFGEEVIQLKRNENKTEVDVGGQKPADMKKKKTATCRTLIEAFRMAPAKMEDVEEFHIGTLGDTEDMFQLRWYTLFVMYSSDAFIKGLCKGSPVFVCEAILLRFREYLDLFLFGETGKQGKRKSAILTPAELVPRFMIDLRNAYFVKHG